MNLGPFLHLSRTYFPYLQNEEITILQGVVALNEFKYVKHLPQGGFDASHMVTVIITVITSGIDVILLAHVQPSSH